MGSLKENLKTGTFPYSSFHIEKSNSLTQRSQDYAKAYCALEIITGKSHIAVFSHIKWIVKATGN